MDGLYAHTEWGDCLLDSPNKPTRVILPRGHTVRGYPTEVG